MTKKSLVRVDGPRDVFSLLDSFRSDIDAFFNSPLVAIKEPLLQVCSGNFPKVNVSESDTAYEIEMAVAGFKKEDVSLEIRDNTLFIKAEHESTEEDSDKKYLYKEIARRSFRRHISFPSKVDVSKVTCNYADGVITCSIGKEVVEEKDDVLKIEIEG